jgi:hypothetical protein
LSDEDTNLQIIKPFFVEGQCFFPGHSSFTKQLKKKTATS